MWLIDYLVKYWPNPWLLVFFGELMRSEYWAWWFLRNESGVTNVFSDFGHWIQQQFCILDIASDCYVESNINFFWIFNIDLHMMKISIISYIFIKVVLGLQVFLMLIWFDWLLIVGEYNTTDVGQRWPCTLYVCNSTTGYITTR